VAFLNGNDNSVQFSLFIQVLNISHKHQLITIIIIILFICLRANGESQLQPSTKATEEEKILMI
jgi:hypothetical protein